MEIEVRLEGSSKYLHIPGETIDKLGWDVGDIVKLSADGDALKISRVATREENDALHNLEMSFNRNSGIGAYQDSDL
ncbi:MAG: hypothetical protein PQJ59_07065 [Spirochaetales bacterium]|nr:hypothetical protein [Spirochaetales bacterium]